jgi:two-component system NtrC family sensor kinase
VACRWRIRHKLLLGLGLVVAVLALLLAGTLQGLASNYATTKSIDSKLAELHEAQNLKLALADLAPDRTPNGVEPVTRLTENAARARQALEAYEAQLQHTIDKHRDPDRGEHELQLIDALKQRFNRLDKAVYDFRQPQVSHAEGGVTLQDDRSVGTAILELGRTSDELQAAIYEELGRRISGAKHDYRSSMVIVLSTSIAGVLLMAGLLPSFYRWMFAPLRHLEEGVARVGAGDFEHPIEVHSGDEMEELATAFNGMTSRLREMYRDLAHQVNERSRQLVRSERLASVGFLAAGVAHEINNPLASIAFCSEALERRLAVLLARAPADGEVVTKYLKMIQQEAFRCKSITQRLLEFSRRGDHHREATDLAELIDCVLETVKLLPQCKDKEIRFAPNGRVIASVSGEEIKSVVLNLVVNALDSMEAGGRLTITLAERDRTAVMAFADTGCGMTPDTLENIFEPFFTRSRTGKGTGLGLTISHLIISQHGGEIEAASAGLNQGSTFTVRLPLKPAQSSEQLSAGGRQPTGSGAQAA